MASGGTDKDKCGTCGGSVGEKEKAIMCEVCEVWYHCKCEKVPDDTYKVLLKDEGVHWYCRSCDKGVAKILSAIGSVKLRQDKLESSIGSLNEKVVEMEGLNGRIHNDLEKLNTRFEQQRKYYDDAIKNVEQNQKKLSERVNMNDIKVENGTAKINEKINEVLEKTVRDTDEKIKKVTEEMKEQTEVKQLTKTFIKDGSWAEVVKGEMGVVREEIDSRMKSLDAEMMGMQKVMEETRNKVTHDMDREARKNNVVMFNVLEEGSSDSWQAQQAQDMSFVCEAMTHITGVDFEKRGIKKTVRLGKRNYLATDEIPCRPLLVEFSEGTAKNLMMQNLMKMRGEEKFRNIVINHDMTVAERLECKKLVEAAKELQSQDQSGECIYRVRGLPGKMRIVTLRKRQN